MDKGDESIERSMKCSMVFRLRTIRFSCIPAITHGALTPTILDRAVRLRMWQIWTPWGEGSQRRRWLRTVHRDMNTPRRTLSSTVTANDVVRLVENFNEDINDEIRTAHGDNTF